MKSVRRISFVFLSMTLLILSGNTSVFAMRCGTADSGINWPESVKRTGPGSLPGLQLPVPEYYVGDVRIFWVWDLSVMPPVDIQISATCRAKGEYGYIWVQDTQWPAHADQSDVDAVMTAWEISTPAGSLDTGLGIYQISTTVFGPAPDALDMDLRIHILFYDIGSFGGYSFDGFFNAYDQMTDEEAQSYGRHSNECEILYLDCNPSDPGDTYMLGVLSHEFQHMIHWNTDLNEATWVNEGCSQLAWYLCGFGTDGTETAFAQNPNNDLTDWGSTSGDYGQVLLFFIYLFEQFGGITPIHAICENSENGFDGIASALSGIGWNFDPSEVFTEWCVANHLDAPLLDHGQYGYLAFDPPPFNLAQTFTTYPTGDTSAIRKNWAAYYARYQNGTTQLNADFNRLDGDFQGYLVYGKNDTPQYVMRMDPAYQGMQVDDFGAAGAHVDFIVVNRQSPESPQDFEYSATDALSEDATPPFVLRVLPWGIDTTDPKAEAVLRDALNLPDITSIAVWINDQPVTPLCETIGEHDLSIVVPIDQLPAQSMAEITISASDDQGFGMTPFTWYFRTSDRPPIELGVELSMPSQIFHEGDECYLNAVLTNPDPPVDDILLFVILYAYDNYYFAPTWMNMSQGIDHYARDLPTGSTSMEIIPSFFWPELEGSASGLLFYGAMTDPGITQILGSLDIWEFGWE